MRAPPRASMRAPLLAATTLVLGLTGCSSAPYLYQTYVGTVGRVTRIDCQEAYEVFEKPSKRVLMVRSSPGVEVIRAVCANEPAVVRYRKAAQQYLVETDRPYCTASPTVNELTPLHVEFSYECKPPPPIVVTPPRPVPAPVPAPAPLAAPLAAPAPVPAAPRS